MMVVDVAEKVSWKYQFKFMSLGVIMLVTASCSTKPMEKNLEDRNDRENRRCKLAMDWLRSSKSFIHFGAHSDAAVDFSRRQHQPRMPQP